MTLRCFGLTLLLLAGEGELLAQADSVDVTFRYQISGQTLVSVPGEFNGWTPANGRMVDQGGGLWTRTVRLRLGGNPNPLPPPGGRSGRLAVNILAGHPHLLKNSTSQDTLFP